MTMTMPLLKACGWYLGSKQWLSADGRQWFDGATGLVEIPFENHVTLGYFEHEWLEGQLYG